MSSAPYVQLGVAPVLPESEEFSTNHQNCLSDYKTWKQKRITTQPDLPSTEANLEIQSNSKMFLSLSAQYFCLFYQTHSKGVYNGSVRNTTGYKYEYYILKVIEYDINHID